MRQAGVGLVQVAQGAPAARVEALPDGSRERLLIHPQIPRRATRERVTQLALAAVHESVVEIEDDCGERGRLGTAEHMGS